MLNKATYIALMLTTLAIGVVLLVYLPEDKMLYVFFLPIAMWGVYYLLITMEKKREHKNKSSQQK